MQERSSLPVVDVEVVVGEREPVAREFGVVGVLVEDEELGRFFLEGGG